MKKILVLVRHAHRDVTHRHADNGLTDKGRTQAVAFKDHFVDTWEASDKKTAWKIFTSPKVRCRETVEPLAEHLKIEAEVFQLLNEFSATETEKDFIRRIHDFYEWWKNQAPPHIVACSHGDWIPEFLSLVIDKNISLKKGAWLTLEYKDGEVEMV